MKHSIDIDNSEEAFETFLDDCFLSGDAICNNSKQGNIEVPVSQLIHGIWVNDALITD